MIQTDVRSLCFPDPCTTELPSIEIVSARRLTLEQLTEAYNQTRVDYIVPMPMNPARLGEYVHHYDVDLELSAAAMSDGQILGLAMLGVRPDHTWITRLGVLPVKRRAGAGQYLMEHLIAQSHRLGAKHIQLEVIKNNLPAHRLFLKLGFREVRELLIVRRPPRPPDPQPDLLPYTAGFLNYTEAVQTLQRRRSQPSWLDETPSLLNAGNLAGLHVRLQANAGGSQAGGEGWIVYQQTVFQLGRLVLQTESGDPYCVGQALAHALHTRHPALDTKSENLPVNDPHWPALQAMGYVESFRRIEMRLDLC